MYVCVSRTIMFPKCSWNVREQQQRNAVVGLNLRLASPARDHTSQVESNGVVSLSLISANGGDSRSKSNQVPAV